MIKSFFDQVVFCFAILRAISAYVGENWLSQYITTTQPHNGSNNKQQANNNRTTTLERTAAPATGGPNAPHWHQIFAPDSTVAKAQEMPSPHGSPPTIAMHHHGETLQSKQHTMTKQRKGPKTHRRSELKKTPSWATVGPATDKHQAPTHRSKLYVRAIIESEAWPTVV